MNGEQHLMRDRIAAAYLQHLQELASEINLATGAIAANALPAFQESVAKQEMLSASLASMANTVSQRLHSPQGVSPSQGETAIESRIRQASLELNELNLRYAALLRHSGKSIALLASLCRTHAGQFQEGRGPRLKRQTWSCEM
jgi:hypothetical protein